MKKIVAIALCCLANLALAQGHDWKTPGAGDPDSFGRSMTYLGWVQMPQVFFSPDCATFTGYNTEYDQCVTVTPTVPGGPDPVVNFSFPNMGSMVIPKEGTHSQIWPVMINKFDVSFIDHRPVPTGIHATFMVNLVLTIESDVLKDPSIIDQSTGLPANGKFVSSFNFTHGVDQSPVSFMRLRGRADGPGMAAYTSAFLQQALNLNKKQLEKLFKSPITIRYGFEGQVRNVQGYANAVIRIMGD